MVALRGPDHLAHHRKRPARPVGESIPALPHRAGRHSAALNVRQHVQSVFKRKPAPDLNRSGSRKETASRQKREPSILNSIRTDRELVLFGSADLGTAL